MRSAKAMQAFEIVSSWPSFNQHARAQRAMARFVKAARDVPSIHTHVAMSEVVSLGIDIVVKLTVVKATDG